MVQLAGLKSLRHRKALTQQELADKAGLTRSTVARIEGGEEPFPTTIRKLAGALGVRPEDLFPGAADPTTPGRSRGWTRDAALSAIASAVQDGLLTIADGAHVTDLLQERPELQALVVEAAEQLRRLIPGARLELSLLADPDYGEEQQLFLGISTQLTEADALSALLRFDEDWWVRQVCRANGLLCIDLNDD